MAAHEENGPVLSRLIFGLVLIVVGIAYTLDRLNYFDAQELWKFWPIVLIAAGVGKLLNPGSDSSRLTGALISGVGAWILLGNLGLVAFDFGDWWPVLLIALGIRVLFGAKKSVSPDNTDTVNSMAVMGATVRSNSSASFQGGDMLAFMGGCEVNLTSARISSGPAVIDVFVLWGGVEITVPESWRVTVKGIPVMGAFEDSTELVANPDMMPQELVVKGFAIMGGVEIRNR